MSEVQEPTRQTIRLGGGAGPLATLTGSGDKFKFSAFNYPSNIESLSHALLFNINVQEASNDYPTEGGAFENARLGREIQETNIKETRAQNLTKGQIGLTRKTKRVKRAISLYIPDSVVFDNRQKYEEVSLMEKLGIGGTVAATGASQGIMQALATTAIAGGLAAAAVGAGVAGGATAGGATRATARVAGVLNNSFGAVKTAAQIAGFAANPVIEVLYAHPMLRTFNFDFIFAPRNAQEADMVWQIIFEFRRHSTPEIFAGGTLFVPPSEFEITFLRKSGNGWIENTNIPRISTCVMEDIQVDYASSGSFVTFNDGMPVQIRMRLQFKEVNIITREAIDKGY